MIDYVQLFSPGASPRSLPVHGSAPPQWHVFPEDQVWAVRAALATGRPLLLRGEPGTGKSQLARAAAVVLRRPWVTYVVTSQSTSEDLLWDFDAVARLGNAQVLGATARGRSGSWRNGLQPARYLKPGPLWWAFDWDGATRQLAHYHEKRTKPPFHDPGHSDPANGVVLLIDEIDKADADLPNGLLDALGNGGFEPPHGVEAVRQDSAAPPLVVITTNEERELPAAFLRRCLVLNLALPTDPKELRSFLMDRGLVHFASLGDETGTALREKAAEMLIKERSEATSRGLPRPGQAEYLDLLRAVCGMTEKAAKAGTDRDPLVILNRVASLALTKHPKE